MSSKSSIISLTLIILLIPLALQAQTLDNDPDNDQLLNVYEEFFGTNPNKPDTDDDGYSDYEEIIKQYSPLRGFSAKLMQIDTDGDELWDFEEVRWGTDIKNPDSDNDGFKDKLEIISGYDPNGPGNLPGWIKINLSEQALSYGNGPKLINTFPVSTGTPSYKTPLGNYAIRNKVIKAWSKKHQLWMPFWMAFTPQGHGIHELPIWPSGYREGNASLGQPVSHGCVRLGIGPAEELYNWADIDTSVWVVK